MQAMHKLTYCLLASVSLCSFETCALQSTCEFVCVETGSMAD